LRSEETRRLPDLTRTRSAGRASLDPNLDYRRLDTERVARGDDVHTLLDCGDQLSTTQIADGRPTDSSNAVKNEVGA
jgi:hypothetical protein